MTQVQLFKCSECGTPLPKIALLKGVCNGCLIAIDDQKPRTEQSKKEHGEKSPSQPSKPKVIEVINRAWKGTRLTPSEASSQAHPFTFALTYHHGRQAYVITIYEYDPENECYEQRFSQALKRWKDHFYPELQQCLDFAQAYFTEHYYPVEFRFLEPKIKK